MSTREIEAPQGIVRTEQLLAAEDCLALASSVIGLREQYPGLFQPFYSRFKPVQGVQRADMSDITEFRNIWAHTAPELAHIARLGAVIYEPGAELPETHHDHDHSAPVSVAQIEGHISTFTLNPGQETAESTAMHTGDGITIDGSKYHDVENASSATRISLVMPGVDLRNL